MQTTCTRVLLFLKVTNDRIANTCRNRMCWTKTTTLIKIWCLEGTHYIRASPIPSTCSWWKPFGDAAEPYPGKYLRVTLPSSRADVKSFLIFLLRVPGTSDEVPRRASSTKHTRRYLRSRNCGLVAAFHFAISLNKTHLIKYYTAVISLSIVVSFKPTRNPSYH